MIMTSKTALKALTLLRSAPMTANMETKQLKKLASLAREVEFSTAEIIYRKGELGRALYLIEEGEVVIEAEVVGQDYVPTDRLGPGEFFGWSSLFPPARKLGQTRVVKPTRSMAFEAEGVRLAMQSDHNLEYSLVRLAGQAMIDRIKVMRQQLAELYAPIQC
jgi:CRP/FNR family transcriptional regulator, cyclic AMP receptor protein